MALEARFFLDISRARYLNYYTGDISTVQVRSDKGLWIQFPATALQPWVTHEGIKGNFIIKFDENNKLIDLQKTN